MNGKRNLKRAKASIVLGSLLVAGFAQAEDAAGTNGIYYQVEGEANCNSFSANEVQSFTVQDPALSGQVYSGTLDLMYTVDTVDGLPSLSWETQTGSDAVNAAILVGQKIQGQQKSIVYHFGENGAAMDSGELAPSAVLAKVTFCYGLGQMVEAPPPEPLPVCQDLNSGELLDFTGVQCPVASTDPEDDSDKRFIFSVNPYGQNGGIAVCTCNFDEALTICDASLEAGAEGSCLPYPDQQPGEDPKGLTWPPAEIVIFQNGTGGCYTTLSGGRICFR